MDKSPKSKPKQRSHETHETRNTNNKSASTGTQPGEKTRASPRSRTFNATSPYEHRYIPRLVYDYHATTPSYDVIIDFEVEGRPRGVTTSLCAIGAAAEAAAGTTAAAGMAVWRAQRQRDHGGGFQ